MAAALNINVGILGHVDSGKTSLAKALSHVLSTNSLDKSQQSRERGITLDLGFSAFTVPVGEVLKTKLEAAGLGAMRHDAVQYTLVDCPGHASLIRTIIGGAQIIDMMLLVIDASKGIQAQTVECLMIGEITTDDLIVVLNKVDSIPEAERDAKVIRMKKGLRKALAGYKFGNAPIVATAAAVGGEKVASLGGRNGTDKDISEAEAAAASLSLTGAGAVSPHSAKSGWSHHPPQATNWGLDTLVQEMERTLRIPNRQEDGPFFFSIDHCFPIRGQGTVITGTVLSGSINVNDSVEIPSLRETKKIKSMQMFKQPVKRLRQGDRAGICLAKLDAAALERGIAATPGSVPLVTACLVLARRIRVFKGPCSSGMKFHVTVGHATVMATATFFGARELATDGAPATAANTFNLPTDRAFDWSRDYVCQEEMLASVARPDTDDGAAPSPAAAAAAASPLQWALLEFDTPVLCPLQSLVIGSRLDADVNDTRCRLAFCGRIAEKVASGDKTRAKPRLYKLKQRVGVIDRLGDVVAGTSHHGAVGQRQVVSDVIGRDLFKKETNMNDFIGMKLQTATGAVATIETTFGKGGKFKAGFGSGGAAVQKGDKLYLNFKRYVHDPTKRMHQDADSMAAPMAAMKGRAVPEEDAAATDEPPPPPPAAAAPEAAAAAVAPPAAAAAAPPAAGETREGVVDSLKGDELADGRRPLCIAKGLFTPEENIRERVGSRVTGENGDVGVLLAPFGKAGKCKIEWVDGTSLQVGGKVTVVLAKAAG